MNPTLILINPWIYDFAAYDLWSKPLGLLQLAGHLRQCGFKVRLIDCLDIHHPQMKDYPSMARPKRRLYGTGKFWRGPVLKPAPLSDIKRPFSRYGIVPTLFEQELRAIRDPAAILVTSLMTYWYPGVKEAISLARGIHPGVPVILGGTYARLCTDHAIQNSGADFVVSGEEGIQGLLKALEDNCITIPQNNPDPGARPYPAFDLLTKIDYICLLTSFGCPYRCKYCASHFLNRRCTRRDPLEVLEEIIFWHKDFGIRDFAFYDDALLVESGIHAGVLLERLARLNLNLRFHTPNAIHVREVSKEIADLMHRTGFRTIRLGLEASDISLHRLLGDKVGEGDFERSVGNLLGAGFKGKEIGAYILIGLPHQTVESVIETVHLVGRSGVIPYLSEYSPIPHTALWEQARASSEYDLLSEPLFHNNTLLPCWDDSQQGELPRLKRLVSRIREKHR